MQMFLKSRYEISGSKVDATVSQPADVTSEQSSFFKLLFSGSRWLLAAGGSDVIFTNKTCVNVPRVKDDKMDEYHNEVRSCVIPLSRWNR